MENRRRDKTGTVEGFEHAYEDDLTDKMVSKPSFSLLPFIDRPTEYAIPVFIMRERRSAGQGVVWRNLKYNSLKLRRIQYAFQWIYQESI